MCEINFRAWDIKEKVMCWVSIIDFEHRECVLVYPTKEYKEKTKSFDEIELMQYRNLKDKNNKEIYDGDIVKSPNGELFVVKYDGYCLQPFHKFEYHRGAYSIPPEWFEVIGNVFEHPELLNRKVKQ